VRQIHTRKAKAKATTSLPPRGVLCGSFDFGHF
jgi:hypothetical protein